MRKMPRAIIATGMRRLIHRTPSIPGPELLAGARHHQLVGARALAAGKDLFANNLNHEGKNSIEHSRHHSANKPEIKRLGTASCISRASNTASSPLAGALKKAAYFLRP